VREQVRESWHGDYFLSRAGPALLHHLSESLSCLVVKARARQLASFFRVPLPPASDLAQGQPGGWAADPQALWASALGNPLISSWDPCEVSLEPQALVSSVPAGHAAFTRRRQSVQQQVRSQEFSLSAAA